MSHSASARLILAGVVERGRPTAPAPFYGNPPFCGNRAAHSRRGTYSARRGEISPNRQSRQKTSGLRYPGPVRLESDVAHPGCQYLPHLCVGWATSFYSARRRNAREPLADSCAGARRICAVALWVARPRAKHRPGRGATRSRAIRSPLQFRCAPVGLFLARLELPPSW